MENKYWNAYVSYFHSLKDFYVQNKSDIETIQEITKSLQLIEDKLLPLDSIKKGDLVAAKYEDGLWYRGKILEVQENNYTVFFIDYGNSELSKNFKKLPKHLADYHVMARHCILVDINYEEHVLLVNNEVYNIFSNFLSSIEIIVSFLNDQEPYEVEIKFDNRNIKTFLTNIISYGITPKIYEFLKKVDDTCGITAVNLICIKSINEFYVEIKNNEIIKNKIFHEIENGTVWKPVTKYTLGKMVVAKNVSDNRWYRGRILDKYIEDSSLFCTCYFIDYGIQGKCIEIYEADGYLGMAPPLIKRCSLYMPNVKTKLLLTKLSQSFIDEMSISKNRSINISIIEPGEPCIVELIVDDINIADVIKPQPVVITLVSHINAFTAQLNSPARRAALNELNTIESLSEVEEPRIGNIYGANVNGFWIRVQLIKKSKKPWMDVTLVDISDEIITVDALFALPKHIENVKIMKIHCSFYLNAQNYSKSKFKKICNHGEVEFSMIVIRQNYFSGHHVSLFLDDKDVLELIKKD